MMLRRAEFTAMASPCRLLFHLESKIAGELAAEDAISEVARIERKYSRYRDDSELSRINRAAEAGGSVEVDEETGALLDFAFAAHARSNGLFDISSGLLRRVWDFRSARLPGSVELEPLLARIGLAQVAWQTPRLSFARTGMELDFGGIAKEYAVDRAVDVLRSHGIAHGLVDLGGDVAVLGPQPGGAPWQVAVRHPRRADDTLVTLALTAGGLASSGDYERYMEIDGTRYCHILDPHSGMPCRGLMAVSVAAPTCMLSGVLATTAMLKGADGPAFLEEAGRPHLYVDDAGICGGDLAAAGTPPSG